MKSLLFLFTLAIAVSFQACKSEPGSDASGGTEWKEVKFANALEVAHSIERVREGWIPGEIVPSGVDFIAAFNPKDSVMFMTYRIVQQSEIGVLATYLEKGAASAEEFSNFNKVKSDFAWWPTEKINEDVKAGKLLLGKAHNQNTNENVYYGLDKSSGQLYMWKDVFVWKDATNAPADSAATAKPALTDSTSKDTSTIK